MVVGNSSADGRRVVASVCVCAMSVCARAFVSCRIGEHVCTCVCARARICGDTKKTKRKKCGKAGKAGKSGSAARLCDPAGAGSLRTSVGAAAPSACQLFLAVAGDSRVISRLKTPTRHECTKGPMSDRGSVHLLLLILKASVFSRASHVSQDCHWSRDKKSRGFSQLKFVKNVIIHRFVSRFGSRRQFGGLAAPTVKNWYKNKLFTTVDVDDDSN